MMERLVLRPLLIAAAAALVAAASAHAQVLPDTVPPRDTTAVPAQPPADTLPPDTIPPRDAGAADTVPVPAVGDTIPGDTVPAPAVGDTVPADTTPPAAAPPPAVGDTLPPDSLEEGGRTPPPDPEADAILQELRRLEGYTPTEYLGERAIYRTDEGVLRLIGDAQVEREGDRLNADSIIYRDRLDLVEAYGSPKVTGQAQELTADILYYDLATRRATGRGARTEVAQAATWFVTGDVTLEGTTRIYATDGHFTTCDLTIPHYHFEADRIKIVKDKYLVGRPARLYFGRVPVMILPFFVQSLEEGRRSGFILPRFSFTDIVRNSGHTREISQLGWYWAVNDYLGAQVTGTWRSNAYTAVMGNLDYRWRRQFLDGNFGFTRYWQNSGQRNFAVDARTSWRPDERTSLSGSGRYASSSQFIRESTIDPLEATQDLNSSFSMSRKFDWGSVALGATGQQSMANGSLRYTLPSFSVSPNPITLFRSSNPATARWYNDASFQWGFKGTRTGVSNRSDFLRRLQDEQNNDLNGNMSFSLGRLSLSTSGRLQQTVLDEVEGFNDEGESLGVLTGGHRDRGSWNASIGYQQELIGQTTLTPSLGFSQEVRRDSLTGFQYLTAPMRTNFGASLSSAIFGFYPGIGPFASIRHRVSPTLGFTFSPAVQQTARQDTAFGAIESRTQNVLTFGFNQTWEAKLRRPRRDQEADSVSAVMDTTTAGDTLAARSGRGPIPQQEEKVTLLSINTSSFTYDFTRAAETGTGFTNTSVSNSFTSDYLRGLTIQMTHDLFDQSDINPDSAEQRGQLGRFAPRLSSLSTGFDLGPNSAVFRWLRRLGGSPSTATEGTVPGTEGRQPGEPGGSSTATGNPQAVGSGQWRTSIDYSYTRPRRSWDPRGLRDDRAIQTMNLSTSMPLTPNWSADWRTMYSITDSKFAGHSLNFSRALHRWRANFSFFQTATGNTGFQFYVELIDNTDLQVEYRERNLGIDR